MFKSASRMLFLVPAVTFGMGAAFVLSSFALGFSPQSPAVWHAFIALAPLTRDPVNLMDSIPGIGYGITFILFALLAAGSLIMAFTSWGSDKLRFVASHLALFPLIYSMGKVSMAYTSIAYAEPLTFWGRFSRVFNFNPESSTLIVLFLAALAGAVLSHVGFFRRIMASEDERARVNGEYRKLLAEFTR
jgi:hypothetical protein